MLIKYTAVVFRHRARSTGDAPAIAPSFALPFDMAGSTFSENALLVIGGTATLAVYASTGASLSGLTEALLGTRGLRAGLRSVRGGSATAVFDEVVREVEALWTSGAERIDEGAACDARLAAEEFFRIAGPERIDVAGCSLDPDRLTERIVDSARRMLPAVYGKGRADVDTRVRFLALVTGAALGRLLAEPDFIRHLAPATVRRTLEMLDVISDKTNDTNAMVRTLHTEWTEWTARTSRDDTKELWALSLESLLGRSVEPQLSELMRASAELEKLVDGGRSGAARERAIAVDAVSAIDQIRRALADGELDKAEALTHHRHTIDRPGDGYWARVYAFVLQQRGSYARAADAYEKAASGGGALPPSHVIECRLEQAGALLSEADSKDTWEPYERALSVVRDHALPAITSVESDADRAHFLGRAASVIGVVGSAREDVALVREARDVLDNALSLQALDDDRVRFSFELNRANADLDIGIFEGDREPVSAACRRFRSLLDEAPSDVDDLVTAATGALARGLLWRGHMTCRLAPLFEAVRRCGERLDAMPSDAPRCGSLERSRLRARLLRAELIGFGAHTIDGECVFGSMEMADVLRALDTEVAAAEPSSSERVAFRVLRAGALLASAKLDRSAGPRTGNYQIATDTIDRSIAEYRALVKDLPARGRARFAYDAYGALASALSTRGRWRRSVGDLEAAIQLWQDELDDARYASREGHWMVIENNRGNAMVDALELGSEVVNIDEAVRYMEEAMTRATPEMDARDQQRLHRNLGRALLSRAKTKQRREDAEAASKELSRALELLALAIGNADDTYCGEIVAELDEARQLAR